MLTLSKSSMLSDSEGKLPYMNMLGDRIKQQRQSLRMTQQGLATKVGVSRAAVSQWENGDTKGLRPANLLATAKALGADVEWLVTGESAQTQPEEQALSYYIEPGVLTNILDALVEKFGRLPSNNRVLAETLALVYTRTMHDVESSNRDKVRSILADTMPIKGIDA